MSFLSSLFRRWHRKRVLVIVVLLILVFACVRHLYNVTGLDDGDKQVRVNEDSSHVQGPPKDFHRAASPLPAKGMNARQAQDVVDLARVIDSTWIDVWPIPQKVLASDSYSTPSVLSADLRIVPEPNTPRVSELSSLAREYLTLLKAQALLPPPDSDEACRASNSSIAVVVLAVGSEDLAVNLNTDYGYTLEVDGLSGKQITIRAHTVYGARYGLETLLQLVSGRCVRYNHIRIEDYPEFKHRGFMLDTGRRFVPKSLLFNFLDAMSMVKMSVFHWHLSDWCLYSIQSKLYPELNSCNSETRCYNAQEVKDIVKYAMARGIRVIPEIDIPGHAKGLQQLSKYNLKFCDDSARQIYNDPEGSTLAVIKNLVGELMELFPDEYFHIGCDETSTVKMCNLNNIKQLEESLAEFLIQNGKIPIGWEEALFTTGVKIDKLVVQGWLNHRATEIASKGYYAIESNIAHYYLDYVERDLWKVWSGEIAPEKTQNLLQSRILGGEFAMWGDMWIKNRQCWDEPNWQFLPRSPVAYWMHDQQHDEVFMDSMAGLVWPRGLVAAGRFWKYSSHIDSFQLKRAIDILNKFVISRGIKSCPVGCTCDYLNRCGAAYPR